jgi:hypothetical protein
MFTEGGGAASMFEVKDAGNLLFEREVRSEGHWTAG